MKNRKRIKGSSIVIGILAALLFLITIYPFFLLVCGSLKDKMQLIENPWFFENPIHFENYTMAFESLIKPMFNSLINTVCGLTIVIVCAGLAAYAIVFLEMPGKNIIFMAITALLMVPFFAILIPQFVLVRDMGLYNTYVGQFLPVAAGDTALATMLMRTFFQSISKSVIESAKVEGCSSFQLFWKIVLPLSKPIVSTVAIISGLYMWNDFIWPTVVTSGEDVMPIAVAITKIVVPFSQGDGVAYAGYVIAAIPILVLFSLASKQFVKGMMAGAVKG